MIKHTRFFPILIIVFLTNLIYPRFSLASPPLPSSPEAIFNEGITLFHRHQYAAAQQWLERYLNLYGKKYKKEEANYYAILAAIENKEPNIEILVQHFVTNYPTSKYIAQLHYYLAKHFYENNFFHKSLSQYKKIKVDNLPPKEKNSFSYNLASTYLHLEDWPNAKKEFSRIKNKNNSYYYLAQLHKAYIAFKQCDYNGALALLQEASKYKEKAHIQTVASLTLKIYHKAQAFDSLLDYVKNISGEVLKKEDQILIADAYFFLKQYKEAIPHYQSYLGKDPSFLDRRNFAKLGYAFYAIQQYVPALACFHKILLKEDPEGQKAAYYSGLIYEKENDLPKAIEAFNKAEHQKFDPEICELACIKCANLYYQQEAFTEAIQSIQKFLQENPESKNLFLAHTLLVQCYYKTKAYSKAIDHIAQLPYRDKPLLQLYQKILFRQGLEEYNKRNLDKATHYLKESLLFPFKGSLTSAAQFWLAEAFSALEAYSKALKFYLLLMKDENLNAVYQEKALYGLAYIYFNMGNYTESLQTFKQYISIAQKQPSLAYYDGTLRIGDCYYAKKRYQEALDTYERVYAYYPAHVRYQEALIYQLLGDSSRATNCLQEIINQHMDTPYYEKARFQEACMVFNAGQYEIAIQKFSLLIQQKLNSPLQSELLMKRALAYENLHKYEEAFADYITILDQYPTHVNAESALMALSNLSAKQGTSENINGYLKKYPHIAQRLHTHGDEYALDMAKKFFDRQEYEKVLQELIPFEKKYPTSPFLTEVYFLIAESYYRLQRSPQAMRYYKKIISHSQTAFHKKAWLRMADITLQQNHYQEALAHYQKLQKKELNNKEYHRTLIGIMKASFFLKQYKITIPSCLQLLNNPREASTETIQQAYLYLGKVAMQRAEYTNAKHHFLKAASPPSTATAAEAQYLLAQAAFKLKDYTTSLNSLFDLNLIEKFPYNKNYIDSSFLLIADNYIRLGNLTQAKATLDSIIKQSKNRTHIASAKKKRAEVIAQLKKTT